MSHRSDVVGLIPAGGVASRLGALPCSKEIFPVGFSGDGPDRRPRPACAVLLAGLRRAAVERAFFIVRPGKWDIPALLGDGAAYGIALGYLTMGVAYGAPFTIDQAYPFIKGMRVAVGFPDIVYTPVDALDRILTRQETGGADIVLGLFPTDRPHKADMVDLDEHGRVRDILIKPAHSTLAFTWIHAVWTARVSEFLHDYLQPQRSAPEPPAREVFMSHIILAARAAGMSIETVSFPDGRFLDIGTPDDLARALAGDL